MTVAAIMFEGGRPPRSRLGEILARLREAVALDTLEKLLATPGVDRVVLATNRSHLAQLSAGLGVGVWRTDYPLNFRRALPEVIRAVGAEAVIYLGGVAVPLLSTVDWGWVVSTLLAHAPCVVVNNPQSADLVAWSPAAAVERLDLPGNDNFLGYLLRHEAGLERYLVPNSAAAHFDLDTPTDYLVLAHSGRGGPRAQAVLADLEWNPARVQSLAELLTRDLAEVALVGRVGTAVVEYINTWLRVRLRMFSEERGMKALGRVERGEVISLIAALADAVGPKEFFRHLGSICDGVFFDTRVLFAHAGRRISESDRFYSDLGRPEWIQDSWVRAFTETALLAPVPVLLGGHSVVAGGLWLLAEAAVAARGNIRVTYR